MAVATPHELNQPGWQATTDSKGRVYYFHKELRRTSWDRPPCLDSTPPPPPKDIHQELEEERSQRQLAELTINHLKQELETTRSQSLPSSPDDPELKEQLRVAKAELKQLRDKLCTVMMSGGKNATKLIGSSNSNPNSPGPGTAALAKENQTLKREIQALRAQGGVGGGVGPSEEFTQQINKLTQERDTAQSMCSALKTEISQHVSDKSGLRDQVASLERQLAELKAENEQASQENAKLKDTNRTLTERIRTVMQKKPEHEQTIENLRTQLVRLQSAHEELRISASPQSLVSSASSQSLPPASRPPFSPVNSSQPQARHQRSKTEALGLSKAASNWVEHKDPSTGKSYFHNLTTGVTTWDKPAGFEEPAPAPPLATSDWMELSHAESGKKYYYNQKTGATQWTKPVELQAGRLVHSISEA